MDAAIFNIEWDEEGKAISNVDDKTDAVGKGLNKRLMISSGI